MNTHIIRYAKNHYGRSKDRMSDLKVLIGKWSLIDPEGISDKDVLECVYDVWLEVAAPHDRELLMREMFFNSEHHFKAGLKQGESNVEVATLTLLGGLTFVLGIEFKEKYDLSFAEEEVDDGSISVE